MAVAGIALTDDPALGDLQGSEQGGGAMAVVVMGIGAAPAGLEWQAGLGAAQCTNLALLVDAKDHGVLAGVRYTPTTSLSFSSNSGSCGSMNVLVRCGFRPRSCQAR